jgi:hypothetical protein
LDIFHNEYHEKLYWLHGRKSICGLTSEYIRSVQPKNWNFSRMSGGNLSIFGEQFMGIYGKVHV